MATSHSCQTGLSALHP